MILFSANKRPVTEPLSHTAARKGQMNLGEINTNSILSAIIICHAGYKLYTLA